MKYFLITQLIFWVLLILSGIGFYFFYRFYYFFRDPKRKIPAGNNIVSPADGYVIYIKELEGKEIPFSVKKGNRILLDELIDGGEEYNLLIGIFMTPLSVHYNRIPFSGKITDMFYKQSALNKIMTRGYLNIIFNLKPYTEGSDYIVRNERNVTVLENDNLKCAIVQIADKWVNKIDNCRSVGETVVKGDKLGIIKMGSQCDLFLKIKGNYEIKVKERDYIKAGSSVLIEIKE
jgi:phosphatidylserine decarboxylase